MSNKRARTPERIRVARACDRCKRKKTKCDGEMPCRSCLKADSECAYSQVKDQGDTEKLWQRLEKLEAAFNIRSSTGASSLANVADTIKMNLPDHLMVNGIQEVVTIRNDGNGNGNKRPPSPSQCRQTHGQILPNGRIVTKQRYSRRYMSLLPNQFGQIIYDSLPPKMKEGVSVPRIQTYTWNMSGVHYLSQRAMPDVKHSIDPETTKYLVDYYMRMINPLFSVLHAPVFNSQLEQFLYGQKPEKSRLFVALLDVVCATAMRHTEIREGKVWEPGLEESLFESALAVIQAYSFEWEALEIIQGWLLITMYLRMTHRQSSTYMALGSALRMAEALGLTLPIWYSVEADEYERLKRRRIFWCCYTFDHLLGVTQGRSFSLNDDSIHLDIPSTYVDDTWLSLPAFAMLKLAVSLAPLKLNFGGINHASVIEACQSELDAHAHLLESLGMGFDRPKFIPDVDSSLVAQVRIHHYLCQVFIYIRPMFGLLRPEWEVHRPDKALMVRACKGLLELIGFLQEHKQLRAPWPTILSAIFDPAICFLVLIYTGYDVPELSLYFKKAIDYLEYIVEDGRFHMAAECLWSLKSLNHLVCLNMSATRDRMLKAGIDHGSNEVNRFHFTEMAKLDRDGRELSPPTSAPVDYPSVKSEYSNHAQQSHIGEAIHGDGVSNITAVSSMEPMLDLDWLNTFTWPLDKDSNGLPDS